MRLLRVEADLEPLNEHGNGIEDLLGGTCAYGIRLWGVMGRRGMNFPTPQKEDLIS